MHPDRVREGDLISYPGPPRRQKLAEFFGVGTAHIGIAALTGETMSVVEIDGNGCRKRSLAAIIRHYPKVEVLRIPICDHEARRVAERARQGLNEDMDYAHDLARFGFVWANFRCVEHRLVAPAARALFPAAAVVAWVLGRGKTTCSGFVHTVLEDTGIAWHLPLRFDRTLPSGSEESSKRSHYGWLAHLCSPGDIWCAIAPENRFVLSTATLVSGDIPGCAGEVAGVVVL